MRRLAMMRCGGVAIATFCGCFSQQVIERSFYEPTDKTLTKRDDGYIVGAVKSEATKSGSRDEGDKEFNIGLINK